MNENIKESLLNLQEQIQRIRTNAFQANDSQTFLALYNCSQIINKRLDADEQ